MNLSNLQDDDELAPITNAEAMEVLTAEFGHTALTREASEMFYELRGHLSVEEALEEVVKLFRKLPK